MASKGFTANYVNEDTTSSTSYSTILLEQSVSFTLEIKLTDANAEINVTLEGSINGTDWTAIETVNMVTTSVLFDHIAHNVFAATSAKPWFPFVRASVSVMKATGTISMSYYDLKEL